MKVKIQDVRVAFPKLFRAEQVNSQGAPKFGAVFILEPGGENEKIVQAAIRGAAAEKWGPKAEAVLKTLVPAQKICLREGDLKAQYDGFEGNLTLSASAPENRPPVVVGRDRQPLADNGTIYAGCRVNAIVEVWAQDNQYGKRVNASLAGVQFASDDDAFGAGKPASPDEFEELEAPADIMF